MKRISDLEPPNSRSLLVSTSTFPANQADGTPSFVWDLARALAGHVPVTVLAPGFPGSPSTETWDSVEVHRFQYFIPESGQQLAYGGGMRENLRSSLLARVQVPAFLASQALATSRLVAAKGLTFVNSHWMIPQGLTAAWARGRRHRRFRHLLHIHAADVYMLAKLPFGDKIARYVIERTDAVFADGSHVRDALDDLLGFASGAVLQPNGVYTDLFSPQNTRARPSEVDFPEGYLVFVGRFVEKKGVTYLLRALEIARQEHPGLGLVLIGYGPLEADLRAEARQRELEGVVVFAGSKSHEEIVSYLHHCRVAVVPSIIDSHGETEGMPTVVVEAMAAGCRVVASAVDGIPDVVRHEENGWLCREKDPVDLAEKILDALSGESAEGMAQNALRTAAEYDWAQVAQHYCEVMDRLEAKS